MAYFENEGLKTIKIPLSDFRVANSQPSITDDALISRGRITEAQQSKVFDHFDKYFSGVRELDKVLLIDFCTSGESLLSAQQQLQRYFESRKRDHRTEVHALAICRDSDEPRCKMWSISQLRCNPLDWYWYSKDRRSFAFTLAHLTNERARHKWEKSADGR